MCCLLCPAFNELFSIAPGESRFVPWPGTIHQAVFGICDICPCTSEIPVPEQSFLASITVYTDYACTYDGCIFDDAGVIVDAFGQGVSTTYTVSLSIPYASDEVGFDINPS
jgi:hypothetical protein